MDTAGQTAAPIAVGANDLIVFLTWQNDCRKAFRQAMSLHRHEEIIILSAIILPKIRLSFLIGTHSLARRALILLNKTSFRWHIA